ncbi:MAG: sensor histidine kinase [Candidatus Hodarchaeales archaeon]
METGQNKVFCLFKGLNDIEAFLLSDLAQSEVLRCIVHVSDKKTTNGSFFNENADEYSVHLVNFNYSSRKTSNFNELLAEISTLIHKPKKSISMMKIFIDFSSVNLSSNKINQLVENIENHLIKSNILFTLYSFFLEDNLSNQKSKQIVQYYPYLCFTPSQIHSNFFYEAGERKEFPTSIRDIYQPIELLIKELKATALEIENLEKREFQISTQRNILEFTLAFYLAQDEGTRNIDSLPADLISLMEYHSLKRKYDQKSQILSTIIHDIKSPLASIQGYTEALIHGLSGPITPEMKLNLETIILNTQRLARMVDSLLEFQNYDQSKYITNRETFDLIAILEEAKMAVLPQMIRKGQKITFFAPESVEIVANRELIIRVIQNLLDNAITYSPLEKGKIDLFVEEKQKSGQKSVVITIKDNGFGFRKSDLSRAFQPFSKFEKHSKSTGLGLSIVKKIVEEIHGGTISLTSPGRSKGTTVKITLPKI